MGVIVLQSLWVMEVGPRLDLLLLESACPECHHGVVSREVGS